MLYDGAYDVLGLAQHLRSIGIAVSTQEIRDTLAALAVLNPATPSQAALALSMTLVKDSEARAALATVAPLFRTDGGTSAADPGPDPRPDPVAAHLHALDDDALHDHLTAVLLRADRHGIAAVAAELIDRHVTFTPGAPVAGNVHVMRAYRAARPEPLRATLHDRFARRAGDPLAGLRERLWHDEVDHLLLTLRHEIESEVRRRLVHDRGAYSVAEAIRVGLPADVDLLTASTRELNQLAATVESLPARLQHRLRLSDPRPPSGRLDVRTTMRSAMSTGGIVAHPRFHRRRPPRPDLVVLADISGSVASFARFTLTLAHGLQDRFGSVRSFVFIDGLDEVTDLIRESDSVAATADQIDARGLGIHLDGRSDYGRTFTQFWAGVGHQLSPRTIVLILGDGRSNYLDPHEAALRSISERAGRLFWLNPERQATWSDGDSLIETYRRHCTGVFEVRTLRDLEEFVVRHAA